MTCRSLAALTCAALLCAFLLTGCENKAPQIAPPTVPGIPVSHPVQRKVIDFVDFTGRTEAKEAVDIRPRVTGYLVQMPFKEGAEVKKGDLLFEIDPRPYQAQYDQALGQVTLYQAQLKLAKTTYARDQAIAASGGATAISQQQLDQDRAAVEEAEARVKAYQSSVEVYKLNLSFTKVTSPIDGHISRYYLTRGNLANQDQTLLTTVVSLDPMYVYFDMDEPTLLRIRGGAGAQYALPKIGDMPVNMALQNQEGFPQKGTIDFFNNQVNPTTGSLSVRGLFPNPVLPSGHRLMSPGMFARVRLPLGEAHPALLVIDRAIGSDQGLKFVYVVDRENKVQYRRVKTGSLQDDGLRVITEGLQPDDWIVVGALQQVRPRMQVQPDKVAMPSLASQAAAPAAEKNKE